MFDGATGVQHEWEVVVRLLWKWFPGAWDQSRAAILGLELAVGVEPACFVIWQRPRRYRPLQAAMLLDRLVGHAGVVAETACGDPLPLFEGVPRFRPAGKDLVANTKRTGDAEEDVEVRACFVGRRHCAIDLAHAALGVGVGP